MKIITCIALPVIGIFLLAQFAYAGGKKEITALYIPLADHYAGIVAYEKYGQQMEYADYKIRRMKSWDRLRAAFEEGQADLAYIISPMAMDMFSRHQDFRWISLLHRDGNALAVNGLLDKDIQLVEDRLARKPDASVAEALHRASVRQKAKIEVAVPSLLATHTVVLHKYLKDHGMQLSLGGPGAAEVVAIEVSPPKSPVFLKKKNSRNQAAAFEQSLPWADVVETGGFGKVAWYSKDVMAWPRGHVECIIVATDKAIREKTEAIREVISAVHRAGMDIETARQQGASGLAAISAMIRKHIPEHNHEAIIQSLRPDLMVINYKNLNVDKAGLEQIMNYAVEAGVLRQGIDIEAFTDTSFSTATEHK